MSVTKELIEQEERLVQTGHVRELHLHKEGTFLRAYNWSAWLCCCYLHEFKVNKRVFKSIDEAVAYIGFPGRHEAPDSRIGVKKEKIVWSFS